MTEKFISTMSKLLDTKEYTESLDKHLDSAKNHLTHVMERALSKGDGLRASNALLASSRISGALSRQLFVEYVDSFAQSFDMAANAEQRRNIVKDMDYILARELEKSQLEAKLADIQSSAEKGFTFRNQLSSRLRTLADEIEGGAYPNLLTQMPSNAQIYDEVLGEMEGAMENQGHSKEAIATHLAAQRKYLEEHVSPVKAEDTKVESAAM